MGVRVPLFNSRNIFVPEWEDLWLRYLIARYDAFTSVYFWRLMNAYEFYPDGNWHYNPVADRWVMRIGRWVKRLVQHGHIVSVHQGPREPAFACRFAADPEAIDAIMFQHWGTRDKEKGWLAAGIEDQIGRSLKDWPGSAVFAEYGYERNPDVPLSFPPFEYCNSRHTRRGAWRSAFCALGVINGFENSWGPLQILDQDQPGLVYLLHLHRFFTEVVPFHQMQPAPEIIPAGEYAYGHRPLALATARRDVVAVYLPVGGTAGLCLPEGRSYNAQWYNPRRGELRPATASAGNAAVAFAIPAGKDKDEHPWDWVMALFAQ